MPLGWRERYNLPSAETLEALSREGPLDGDQAEQDDPEPSDAELTQLEMDFGPTPLSPITTSFDGCDVAVKGGVAGGGDDGGETNNCARLSAGRADGPGAGA